MRRLVILVVVALVVAGLWRLDDPHGAPAAVADPVVGAQVGTGDATWFCAAGGSDLTNTVIVTAFDDDVTATVTGFANDAGAPVPKVVEVPAHSRSEVAVSELGAGATGVTVEVSGGDATVAHRLVGAKVADEAVCATAASDRWYFAAADTELVGEVESAARLWILNPFPTDASVDVRVTYDDTTRIPPKLRGVIVPAGTARMVDLNAEVPRHPQFAVAVEARGGRVVAELAQTVPGRGLRLQPGVPAVASSWYLADAFGGPNSSEQLQVFNPGRTDVTASVAVLPNGTDPASFPEPFLLDVPARRYATVDLSAETRLPPEGLRSIRVDVASGPGVVVNQIDTITGAGGDGTAATRPAVPGGLASTSGSSAQSTRWLVPTLGQSSDGQPVVVIANPSADTIAVAKVTAVSDGKRRPVAADLEIPPRQSLAVDLTAATANGQIGAVVTANSPVVVSSRMTSNSLADLWLVPAVPDRAAASSLPGGG